MTMILQGSGSLSDGQKRPNELLPRDQTVQPTIDPCVSPLPEIKNSQKRATKQIAYKMPCQVRVSETTLAKSGMLEEALCHLQR